MRKIYIYSNIRYLIEKGYTSIYSFIKTNKKLKQNTIQDYFNRTNECSILPKMENILIISDIFEISLDDLVYKDLSAEEKF